MSETTKRGRPSMSAARCERVRRAVMGIIAEASGNREAAALRIGVTVPTLGRLIRRGGGPSMATAEKVAKALGVPTWMLLSGKTEEKMAGRAAS